MSLKEQMQSYLQRPVSATNLAILRFGFGFLMVLMLFKYLNMSFIFWRPEAAIPFSGLEFIKPLPPGQMQLVVVFGMIAAAFTAIGFLYRYSIIVLTFVLTYAVFATRVGFNNHYYLFALVSFLLCFTNADERFSVKARIRKTVPRKIPYWQYFILQLQIAIVFFYGGLAKINPDWLGGVVMDSMIFTAFGKFDSLPVVSLAFSWAGMLFDLLIAFFLFWKRTRLIAIIAVVVFNLTNGFLLFDDIGLFPYAMIVLTVMLFLDTDLIDKKLALARKKKTKPGKNKLTVTMPAMAGRMAFGVLIGFFMVQCLLPLRHYLCEGNPDWTGQGSVFAWRMKSNSKIVKLQLKAIDKKTGEFVSDINLGFQGKMEMLFCYSPYQVWYMAQRAHQRFIERGRDDFGVTADYYVAMNGQPIQRAIDPEVDLTTVQYSNFGKNDWILPWQRKSRDEIKTMQDNAIERLNKIK